MWSSQFWQPAGLQAHFYLSFTKSSQGLVSALGARCHDCKPLCNTVCCSVHYDCCRCLTLLGSGGRARQDCAQPAAPLPCDACTVHWLHANLVARKACLML